MRCEVCKVGEYYVAPGWESEKVLKCRNCGQYHYFIRDIHCARVAVPGFDREKAKALLSKSS